MFGIGVSELLIILMVLVVLVGGAVGLGVLTYVVAFRGRGR